MSGQIGYETTPYLSTWNCLIDQLGSVYPRKQKRGSMKKHVVQLMLLLIVVGAGALHVNAQSVYAVKANVPFAFNVGDKGFQAGKIIVRRRSLSTSEPVVISSSDYRSNAAQFTRTLDSTRSERARLVFR